MELENRVINSSAWNLVPSLVGLGEGWDERLCVWSSVLFLRVIVTTSPPAHTWAVQSSARAAVGPELGLAQLGSVGSQERFQPSDVNPKVCSQDGAFLLLPLPSEAGLPWPGIWAGREWMLKVSLCWKAARMKVCQGSGRFQSRSRERIVLFGITDPWWPNPGAVWGAALSSSCSLYKRWISFFKKSLIWMASLFLKIIWTMGITGIRSTCTALCPYLLFPPAGDFKDAQDRESSPGARVLSKECLFLL